MNKKIIIAILITVNCLAYGNSLFNHFVWDDNYLIAGNSYIKSFKYTKQILTQDVTVTTGYRRPCGYYRPVSMLSFMLDYKIWKLNPFGYHLTNVIIHIANTIVLFFLLSLIFKDTLASFLSSLFFALHPIHTEAVTAIFNRMDLLATFFVLSSFILFIKSDSLKKKSDFLGSFIFLILGLFSKEMAVIAILIFIAYDWYFLSDFNIRNLLTRFNCYFYFLLATLFYFVMRLSAEGPDITFGFLKEKDLFFNILPASNTPLKVLTIIETIVRYIKLLVFPVNLSVDYVIMPAKSMMDIEALVSVGTILLLFLLVFYLCRKYKPVSFLIVLFFLTILPISNIFPIGNIFAERFMYFPSISFSATLGLLFSRAFSSSRLLFFRMSRQFLTILLILVLFFYLQSTIIRNYDWRTDISLWKKATQTSPASVRPHYNLAWEYYKRGRLNESIDEFKKGIAIHQKQFYRNEVLGMAYKNIALVYLKTGQSNEAKEYIKLALEISPNDPSLRNEIGKAYGLNGLWDEAINEFRQAIKLQDNFTEAYYNLGITYYNKGMDTQAVSFFKQAAGLDASYAWAYYGLGLVYSRQNRFREAAEEFKKALEIEPDFKIAKDRLEAVIKDEKKIDFSR